MVSVIILTHNAPRYIKKTLKSLKTTKNAEYEVIVLDNKSDYPTRAMLARMQKRGYIDNLTFEKENTMFARGNNTASLLCHHTSEYIMLLNSDVKIKDSEWLAKMLKIHKRGATGLGLCEGDCPRADGYAFLIDRDLYMRYKLDEHFEWWWAVTKLEALLLNDGFNVTAVKNHENILHHYGGKSGKSWKKAKGMDTGMQTVAGWFGGKTIVIRENI